MPPRYRLAPLLAITLLLGLSSGNAGLIGYWSFDNAAQVGQDSSGNAYNLTPVGAAAYVAAGKSGGGLSLNGSGSFLSGFVAGLPVGNSSYTVAAWIKPAAAGDRGIVGWGNYGAVRQVNALRLMGANGFRHYWWGADLDASDAQVTAKGVSLTGGAWHHVVAVYDGTTRAIYLNGQLLVSDTPGANGATNINFRIGSTNNGEFFSGLLDDVGIWNNALTTQEITTLAAGSSPLNGPQITSFSSNKTSAFEGEGVQLSWAIDTSRMSGPLTVSVTRGSTTLFTGSKAIGSFTTNIPDLAGTAQGVTYILTATESGGNNVVRSAAINISGDPGLPTATAQYGLVAVGTDPLPITLAGTDPNGGALSYLIVSPPAHGTLSGPDGSQTYTAPAGYFGPDRFTFKVSDGKYESSPAIVSLTVTPPPTAPTAINLSSAQLAESTPAGAFIANISTSDVNVNEAHTYTFVAGAGSTDNARFSIVGHQLRAAQLFAEPPGTTFSIRLRSTDAQGLSVEQSFVFSVFARLGGVVLNEVHYNGLDNTVRNDFVELHNSSSEPISLNGWRLSGAIDYNFPNATTLPPGGYLLVAEDPATIQTRWGKTALGPWNGALNSEGETLRLRDPGDAVIAEVDYKVGFPWPVSPDGEGASMELMNPSLDSSLGSSWRAATAPAPKATNDTASPGAQNLQFAPNAAPNIRQVDHTPKQPAGSEPIVIRAYVTDPDGVASVQLHYQVVAPGTFIPARLPNPIVNRNINTTTPLALNPEFDDSRWATVPMRDDGVAGDGQGGDSTYTAVIPGQVHRALVRYRITIADNAGVAARVPYPDDPSLNFACFVYNGVPSYQGISPETLQTLPVYHFLTRKQDHDDCVAYDPNKQLTGGTPAWTFENWEAAFVFEGVVFDHLRYRLHGGNGRYYYTSKRGFRYFFNKGAEFQNRDNDGNLYPNKWNSVVTENCWENRGTLTYSLNEVVNFHLWNQLGIPSPLGNWAHFRTIMTPAEQPDPWHGDFWGLIYLHEDYDGRFLDAHDVAKGNLYKLTRDPVAGSLQQRYQAPYAVKDSSDHANIYNNLRGTSTPAFIDAHVNLERWSRYHALAQAVRHYDYWPSGDNNGAYYFEPIYTVANSNRGKLWILPNDVDATWGPTWNNGHDRVYDALFNASASPGGDVQFNPTLWPIYFNQVREVRDLLWQRDQIDPLLEEFAAVIAPFIPADSARWKNAPADSGNYNGLGGPGATSLPALLQDMKNFAWVGGSWPGGGVGAGGQAAFLDTLQRGVANSEGAALPATPTVTYFGAATHAVNDLRFRTSAFNDPQGANTFAATQWRMAEITDPNAPAYVVGEKLKLEVNASYDSGELATTDEFRFPAAASRAGHTYRARVRHKDNSGRWSHWATPVQFTAGAADLAPYRNALVVSEFMYHPLPPTPEEAQLGYTEDDFEYLEIRNVSADPINMTDVRFTKGVNFDFSGGATLAPGAVGLIVRNTIAFNQRYGSGKPIIGAWQSGDALSNGGEEIKLSFGAGEPIIAFAYDDESPWPAEADTLGYSLVLISPERRPDPTVATNWRTSRMPGGNPGFDDRFSFAAWGATYGVTNPTGDEDGDGIENWLEYALAGNPQASDTRVLPVAQRAALAAGGVPSDYLTISFTRQIGAEDARVQVEFSTDMVSWSDGPVRVRSLVSGDGTSTETWRAPIPVDAAAKAFLRLQVTGQ